MGRLQPDADRPPIGAMGGANAAAARCSYSMKLQQAPTSTRPHHISVVLLRNDLLRHRTLKRKPRHHSTQSEGPGARCACARGESRFFGTIASRELEMYRIAIRAAMYARSRFDDRQDALTLPD
jgi:hypothetical protein